MKKIFLTITLSLIAFSVVFSAERGSIKVEKGQKVLRKVESEPTFYNDGVASSKPVIHNTENRENQTTITLIDSSTNGFGMVSSATRPLIVTEDENWFVAYRQYAGLLTTHGQLGGAFSGDGVEWDVYNNLNSKIYLYKRSI